MTPARSHLPRQQGATLVIALIILIMLTLFAVSSINLSSTNLQVVGNMQAQRTLEGAARGALDELLSSTNPFADAPEAQNLTIMGASVAIPTTGTADEDVNGDGTVDQAATVNASYAVTVPAAVCLRSQLAPGGEATQSPSQVISGGKTLDTTAKYYDNTWQLNAKMRDTLTGSSVVVSEGVQIRMIAECL